MKSRIDRVVHGDDLAGRLFENLAFRGDCELFAAALEEDGIELLLQHADLLADGALCDAIPARGKAETAGLDEGAENLECFDLHVREWGELWRLSIVTPTMFLHDNLISVQSKIAVAAERSGRKA